MEKEKNEKWYKKVGLFIIGAVSALLGCLSIRRIFKNNSGGVQRVEHDIESAGTSVGSARETASGLRDTTADLRTNVDKCKQILEDVRARGTFKED